MLLRTNPSLFSRKVFCCSTATKFNSLSKSGGGLGKTEDDSDVLIECRDVYKPFGDKHILKGVIFKIRHGEPVRGGDWSFWDWKISHSKDHGWSSCSRQGRGLRSDEELV